MDYRGCYITLTEDKLSCPALGLEAESVSEIRAAIDRALKGPMNIKALQLYAFEFKPCTLVYRLRTGLCMVRFSPHGKQHQATTDVMVADSPFNRKALTAIYARLNRAKAEQDEAKRLLDSIPRIDEIE